MFAGYKAVKARLPRAKPLAMTEWLSLGALGVAVQLLCKLESNYLLHKIEVIFKVTTL